MLVVFGLIWMLMASIFLIAWSRLHAHLRCLEGVDEADYIDGRAG